MKHLKLVVPTVGFLAWIAFAGISWGNTLSIPYTGGMQTGTFNIQGTSANRPDSGVKWNYPDTVLIGGQFRLSVFNEGGPSFSAPYSRGYWLVPRDPNGTAGFKSPADTIWTEAINFPASLTALDSTYRGMERPDYPNNLNDTLHGFKVGLRSVGQAGNSGFTMGAGYHRILYFKSIRSGDIIYGKLMVYGHYVYTQQPPYVAEGPVRELQYVTIAYTIASSGNLNSGPVGVASPGMLPLTTRKETRLLWSQKDGLMLRDARGILYDLRGQRLTPIRAPVPAP